MKQTYPGGCQCGKVRYEVALDLGEVVACNCSRCSKLGSLFTFALAANFKLTSGDGAMTDFQFNKHIAHHYFCSTCGIQSFARGKNPKDGSDMVGINARCLDKVDVAVLPVRMADGRSY